MKRRKGEYFIGMVYGSGSNRKYSKKRRKRQRKLLMRRSLIIAICCVVLMGLGTFTYFCLVPSISNLFTPDKASPAATADEVSFDEVITQAATTTKVPTEAPTEAPTEPPTTQAPTQAPTTQAPTEAPTEVPTEPEAPKPEEYVTPVIKDNKKDGTLLNSTLYLWNNKAYNLFKSTDKVAKNYATTINDIAKTLDKKVTVYSLVAPNQSEFGLPLRIRNQYDCTSQADNLKTIASNLSKRVTNINCYNVLAEHNDEYIYYGTDHHWTSLGAYYAYTAFCEQTGKTPIDITKLKKNSIDGFVGSFHDISGSSTLYNNSDTVTYYSLPNKTSASGLFRDGTYASSIDVYYPYSEAGNLTYGVFCWGDTQNFVIKSDAGTGKKIAVVKDSYGNAFAPYLTAHYDEIHLIDYRYYSCDLNKYLKDNGIDEVLFLNNTLSANNAKQTKDMKEALS